MTKTSRSKTKVKKPKPIPDNIRQKALAEFQKLRRIEESDDNGYVYCISCGTPMHWKEADGGHYISRTCTATELEPDNVNPQCQRCNKYLRGAQDDYRYFLERKIGADRVRRLEDMKHAYKGDEKAKSRLSEEDQVEIFRTKGKVYYKNRYDEYKARVKELLNDKC